MQWTIAMAARSRSWPEIVTKPTGRTGRPRREDSPLRRRGQGRPALQLQRPGRRRRQAAAASPAGYGKANEVPPAVEKAIKDAQETHEAAEDGLAAGATRSRTASSASSAAARSSWCRPARAPASRPAPASATCSKSCGIHNILTKVHGSTNPINLVKATIDGLLQLRTREEVARLRGVTL